VVSFEQRTKTRRQRDAFAERGVVGSGVGEAECRAH
jgi:hypothetical protein